MNDPPRVEYDNSSLIVAPDAITPLSVYSMSEFGDGDISSLHNYEYACDLTVRASVKNAALLMSLTRI